MQKLLTAALAISAMMVAPHAYSSALASEATHRLADLQTLSSQGTHEWCRGLDPSNPTKLVWVNGQCP